MFILGIIQTECPSLLNHAEDVVKAGIGLMNEDHYFHTKDLNNIKPAKTQAQIDHMIFRPYPVLRNY